MNVAGNLFIPKNLNQNARNPAIIVGHPMGAVKEQSANLMPENGRTGIRYLVLGFAVLGRE